MSLDKLKNLLQHHACFSGSCDHKSTKECFYKIFQDGYETCEYIVGTISDSRVSNLNEENDRLKKIIAKELSENDEFGSEFVMINILKEKLSVAKEALKQTKIEMASTVWKDEHVYDMVEEALTKLNDGSD